MIQLALLQDDTIKKSIINVPIHDLTLSRFNPRTTRPDDDIDKLAQRISRNGFEITRALWAIKNGNGYEVFAGGTRLEAARRAGCKTLPVVLHEGLTDEDIVRLADEDNENDEYHLPVPVVDMWLSYKALDDLDWTQESIAKSKGTSQPQVAKRITYSRFPPGVLDRFIQNNFLNEGHAAEIAKLFKLNNLPPWLDRDSAMVEVIDNVLAKYPKPTAAQFAAEVARYNDLVSAVQELLGNLPQEWQGEYLNRLAQDKTRNKATAQRIYKEINEAIIAESRAKELDLLRQQNEAEAQRRAAELEQIRNERIAALTAKVIQGDAVVLIETISQARLLLTDPPYGKGFQSNRRVASTKAARIANDDESAFDLLLTVLIKAFAGMPDDSTAFVFSSQEYEPEFRNVVKQAGFTYKDTYIWHKPNHGTGDLDGTFAPQHECIIHAVKGNPKLRFRPSSVLEGREFLKTDHPTPKPLDLLDTLIKATTDEQDLVIDPFCGAGSTLVSAYRCKRDFAGIELNKSYHQEAQEHLYELVIKDL